MHRSTSRLLATTCVQVAGIAVRTFLLKRGKSPAPFLWFVSSTVEPAANAAEIRVRFPDESLLAIVSFLFFGHFFLACKTSTKPL